MRARAKRLGNTMECVGSVTNPPTFICWKLCSSGATWRTSLSTEPSLISLSSCFSNKKKSKALGMEFAAAEFIVYILLCVVCHFNTT